MEQPPSLRIPTLGISVDSSGCDVDDLAVCAAVEVRVGGDESFAAFVQRAVAAEWVGVEALAGLPGSVADVTRDNASRFGQEVADTVVAVRTWDRESDAQRTFPASECGFRPGASRFQETRADGTARYEILDVAFLFRQGDLTAPVQDADLAASLGVALGDRVRLARVRDLAARPR
ncbi:MAG TPA: hypothetical protein VHO26_01165 [Propionibacteriaceae bacterium]|nr:hypothetical protein [Propionibacteriaceae bacterium]